MKINLKKYFIKLGIGVPLLGATIVALVVGNAVFKENADAVINALCPSFSIVNEEDAAAIKESGIDLAKRIVREGSVLVKNDKNTLPLSKTASPKVNVFGHGSIDWIVGGSGSGQIASEPGIPTTYFLPSLKNYGIEYNQELANFYTGFDGARGTIGILNISSHNSKDFYVLSEPTMAEYSSNLLENAKNYSDTAFVVLGRRAGETLDPPRTQYKTKNTTDTTRHYLEISTEEEALLNYVGANYDKVVVIVNSLNCMELDFLDTIPGLDACLVVGGSGNNGATGIAELIYGDYSPSGRLSDTYPYDFAFNINDNHAGLENVNHYTNAGALNLYPKGVSRNAGTIYTDNASYIDYVENIYVGYKWFETADKEGYWNNIDNTWGKGYEGVVQFPFGYGMSYTTFDWTVTDLSIKANSSITNLDKIDIKVKVTNTGEVAGKEVVQVYLTAPYTKGGIEKSYVSLKGIGKTTTLEPGKAQEITISLDAKEFESYDVYDKNSNGHAGYELEKGTYQLKLMTDSHNIKQVYFGDETKLRDGIIEYKVDETIKVTKDEVTGNKVENRFTIDAQHPTIPDRASIDGSNGGKYNSATGKYESANIPFISRGAFPELSSQKAADREINDEVKYFNLHSKTTANSEWDKATTDYFGNPVDTTPINWGSKSGTKLFNSNGEATEKGLKLGKDYNDPEWEDVLDQVTYNEALGMANSNALRSAAVPSVGKPESEDYDGPAQVRSFNAGNSRGTGFPNSTVLAQSFSPSLSYEYGLAYGKEMIAKGVDGALAFGTNIHRSPFQGRNYEYFSEDGVLSGIILSNQVKGLNNTGRYCFLKHFVLAENEHEREATYVWVTEQALREIYLKPFQMAVQIAKVGGMMTSYNRIGSQWTGSSEALCTGVARYEWGFNGAFVTDWSDHEQFMENASAVRAGCNLGMSTTFGSVSQSSASIRLQHRFRESVKQVLFCHLSSQYIASIYDPTLDNVNVTISSIRIESWDWVSPLILVVNTVGGLFIGFGFYMVLRPIPTNNEPKVKEEN